MIVLFDEAALADVEEARAWYANRGADLAYRFEDAVRTAVDAIATNPEAYPVLYRDARRIRLAVFPFNVHYCHYADRGLVLVVACVHARQSPATWKSRIR